MIVGRWYVQLAAIWHWYLPLYIYIIFVYFILCMVNRCIPFVYIIFNLVSIEWSTIPASPSLMCSFNRGNIEGTDSSEICV